jgi:hypothetical protein
MNEELFILFFIILRPNKGVHQPFKGVNSRGDSQEGGEIGGQLSCAFMEKID